MSDVKSKSVKTGLIMVVRERVTNRRVEGSVETPAKVGIAASEEREGEGEKGEQSPAPRCKSTADCCLFSFHTASLLPLSLKRR